MKGSKKIVAVTSYDHTMATICEEGGADVLLVGDSSGMVMLGYPSTIPVTMEQMLPLHRGGGPGPQEVPGGGGHALHVVPDRRGRRAAKRRPAGAGGRRRRKAGGPVRGVDSLHDRGGHPGDGPRGAAAAERQPGPAGTGSGGETGPEADALVEECLAIQGRRSLLHRVGEGRLPGRRPHHRTPLRIPTIGIGSGPLCDGQVLVIHDLLGMYPGRLRFVKRYASLSEDIRRAVSAYKDDVEKGAFPGKEHYFPMRDG